MSRIETAARQTRPPEVPPLVNGDRLTRVEFHRRYEAMPHVKKAELIRGVVHMPSPVRHSQHSNPHFCFVGWLNVYSAATPGVEGGDNGSILLGDEDEPQPDAYLIVAPQCGGKVRLKDGYVVGAPEWVGEVAASSKSIDLNNKRTAYAENGVQEYVVWRVLECAVDWFVRKGRRFERLPPGEDGIYRSKTMPGLWLDAQALIDGDMRRVFRVARQGLKSAEHRTFVSRLTKRRKSKRKNASG